MVRRGKNITDIIILWAIFGLLYLAMLTYQDIKNKMMVDDRHNYYMWGMTVALSWWYWHSFLYIMCVVVIIIFAMWLWSKYKIYGAADINSLGWIMVGLWVFGAFYMVFYYVLMVFLGFVNNIIAKKIGYKSEAPFYPVIFGCFLTTVILVFASI